MKTVGYAEEGTHVVTVIAEDSRGARSSKDVSITVEDVNQPPVFNEDWWN